VESLRCFCGAEVAGVDGDASFLAMRAHLDQAHHWRPSDEKLRAMLRKILAQQAQMAPLEMFEAAGFERYREMPRNIIVRKTLR
jgi:hypothetical protein